MKAVVYNKKNLPDKLSITEIERPAPGDNEVLVKIHAVSINAADYRLLKMGLMPRKRILGADISGRVESAGKNIRQFKTGDDVLGDLSNCGFGGFAEYVAVPEKALVHKPAKLNYETAAALPLAAVTALQALRDKGNIKAGQKVLIIGSGGGVGTFAVQLAGYFGVLTTAVCGINNVEQMKSLGADIVIDYNTNDISGLTDSYDVILGINGNYPLRVYKRLLKRSGIYVTVGGSLSQIFRTILFGKFKSFGSKKIRFLMAKPNQKDLEFIVKLAEEGKIKPVIDRIYTFDKTIEAVRYIGEGHARGKVVIKGVSAV